MFLLKFNVDGKQMLLHDGDNSFVGGNSKIEAELTSVNNIAKGISVGGFEIVEMTVEQLSSAIGGVPYHIMSVTGGLLPFSGVEILK